MGYFKKKREKYFFFSLLLGLGGFRYFFEYLLPWERRCGCWPGCAYISREYSPLFLCAGGCGGRLAFLSPLWGSSAVAAGLCVYLRTCVFCSGGSRISAWLPRVGKRVVLRGGISNAHLFIAPLLTGRLYSFFLSLSLSTLEWKKKIYTRSIRILYI